VQEVPVLAPETPNAIAIEMNIDHIVGDRNEAARPVV